MLILNILSVCMVEIKIGVKTVELVIVNMIAENIGVKNVRLCEGLSLLMIQL
jgi:hypothetical protein